MATAPFSDGTPQASQWPIPPHHFFDYELHVPIGYAGTYFYHSHVGLQAISAAGPLIVRNIFYSLKLVLFSCTNTLQIEDKDTPPYNYDDDLIIFLQDVFEYSDEVLEEKLLAVPIAYQGSQEMVLINGKGSGIVSSELGKPCYDSLSVIDVEPGKTYRVRLIGGTALSFNLLAIEGHDTLKVIEADGYISLYPLFC